MIAKRLMAFAALILAVLCGLLMMAARPAQAQTETVLYSFAGTPDGANPNFVTLVMDEKGNLYGTTVDGGAFGYGTAFKVTSSGTEAILHSFDMNGTDGWSPYAGLAADKNGNLYGTTLGGGAYSETLCPNGCGTVFELTLSGTETILHSFDMNGTDGWWPVADLVLDMEGNLYGTTVQGGSCGNPYGCGTVFQLTPSGTETILHTFGGSGDGLGPHGGLVFDRRGNLFGTTVDGGNYGCSWSGIGCGTVFKLTPEGTEVLLWDIENGADGSGPWGDLLRDKNGNLYGTTFSGGAYNAGTLFKVAPSGKVTVLHSFNDRTMDGFFPNGGLVRDRKGNLYGTTSGGGAYNGGTMFKLTRSDGKWKEKILWSFGYGSDGSGPLGGLVQDKRGNLYGTTYGGGAYGYGTVFKVHRGK